MHAKPPERIVRFRGKTKRTGNSIAVIIPSDEAKRVGLTTERDVDVEIRLDVESPLGLLQRLGVPQTTIDRISRDWQADKKRTWPDE